MREIVGNSSLFTQRLQQNDGLGMAELIDLEFVNSTFIHWTTANQPMTYTLSGQPTTYYPFPGEAGGGIQEDINLGVSVVAFTMANSGAQLQQQLLTADFAICAVKIGQIFTDSPDLGRMTLYAGKMGDFSYTRHDITGQARNLWKSLNVQWPYYTYQDKCAWRFGSAGCGFNTASITLAVATLNVGSSDSLNILLNSGTLSSSYANGRFNFGRMTVTDGVNAGIIRTIRVQTGDLISLAQALPNGDLTGIKLAIYPGCQKRLLDDCKSTYNNDKNFLGFPWIPTFEQAF